MLNSDSVKRCGYCCRTLSTDMFSANPKNRDGLMSVCISCVDRRKIVQSEWRKANPEKIRAWSTRYKARKKQERKAMSPKPPKPRKPPSGLRADPAVLKEYLREYHRAHYNREENRKKHQEWKRNNPEKAKHAKHVLGARRRNALGSHTFDEWIAKAESFAWCCRYCGRQLTRLTATRDHVIPLSKGGTNYIDNIVPACRSCNSKKWAKMESEFLAELAIE